MTLRKLPLLVTVRDVRTVAQRPTPNELYHSLPWRQLVQRLVASRGRQCEGVAPDGTPCQRTHNVDGTLVTLHGDHVEELADGGAPLDGTNVQLLCVPCHNRKTARSKLARHKPTVARR